MLPGRKLTTRLALVASALGFLAAGLPEGAAPRAEAADRGWPNVLIIVTDDQRASAGSLAVMPKTMEWLRDGGTYYPEGVVTTPLCCPARASIMTGQYVQNHGVAGLAEA